MYFFFLLTKPTNYNNILIVVIAKCLSLYLFKTNEWKLVVLKGAIQAIFFLLDNAYVSLLMN